MNKLPFSVFLKEKPVIGMLHLAPLAGEPGYRSVLSVIHHAQEDIAALEQGGIDGILVENWHVDAPGPFVSKKTAASFASVLHRIVPSIHIPWGINVLHNDYLLAFQLAKIHGADFVQLDVFVDGVRSAFTYSQRAKHHPFEIHPDPVHIKQCAGTIPFFVFIQPKHYEMLDTKKTLLASAHEALMGGASGVIVTRKTGVAPEIKRIQMLKATLGSYPVGVGSGVSVKNIRQFLSIADFCIVGTALKHSRNINNPVDITRVERLMKRAHAAKESFCYDKKGCYG